MPWSRAKIHARDKRANDSERADVAPGGSRTSFACNRSGARSAPRPPTQASEVGRVMLPLTD
jgi:hypothetical protein